MKRNNTNNSRKLQPSPVNILHKTDLHTSSEYFTYETIFIWFCEYIDGFSSWNINCGCIFDATINFTALKLVHVFHQIVRIRSNRNRSIPIWFDSIFKLERSGINKSRLEHIFLFIFHNLPFYTYEPIAVG